jgi:hypothetical protein
VTKVCAKTARARAAPRQVFRRASRERPGPFVDGRRASPTLLLGHRELELLVEVGLTPIEARQRTPRRAPRPPQSAPPRVRSRPSSVWRRPPLRVKRSSCPYKLDPPDVWDASSPRAERSSSGVSWFLVGMEPFPPA